MHPSPEINTSKITLLLSHDNQIPDRKKIMFQLKYFMHKVKTENTNTLEIKKNK